MKVINHTNIYNDSSDTGSIDDYPFVSIIVPAYNAEEIIGTLVESLINQDYPKELLEIIIVDNNSTDNTFQTAKEYEHEYPDLIRILEERDIQSSYAARNTGIKVARGSIIAFIDADCTATPQWIKEGIRTMNSESADLVGGNVEFTYSEKKSAAEVHDSMTNMQIEYNINEEGVAKTANLFVKPSLFNSVGMFPDWVKSGGDVMWTGAATEKGFNLVYSPKAIVKHPARTLKELLKKRYRVGKGIVHIWISEGKTWREIMLLPKQLFFSKSESNQVVKPKRSNKEKGIQNTPGILCVKCLCLLSTGVGILREIFSSFKNDGRK